ncbi:MAG: lamin tail domain-containing protein, partial [Planctomycetales bacterium]|nr:lamin tail domain-containing protein [Planctomycetales bacterium]
DQLTITATQHDATRPWLWFGLTNETVTLTGNTELPANVSTQYLRQEFNYQGEANADHQLELKLLADDGAVIYLNGEEIHRINMPVGPVRFTTLATSDTSSNRLADSIQLPANSLNLSGVNVLAVELHRATASSDIRFGAQLEIVETLRPMVTPPAIVLNELPAVDGATWLELANRDSRAVDLAELRLEILGGTDRVVDLPDGVLQPGELLLVTVPPGVDEGDRVVLYQASTSVVLDAQRFLQRALARAAAPAATWLRPARLTPGAENEFAIEQRIVINEIMYHAPPHYADGASPFAESTEEWLELYNRATESISLDGWSLAGGIRFDFPAGTTIPAEGYLVIAKDAASLRAKWPGITVLGDFDGTLSNRSDRIELRDAAGNPADVVEYFDGGDWPELPDGAGASLELTDPAANNQHGDVWTASQIESAPWVTVTYEGVARPPQGSQDPTEWNEFILGLLDAGEILLDDVSVIEDPQGAAIERMQNGGFEDGDAHWRTMGDHGQHGLTRVVVDPSNPTNHVLQLVAHGATEHMSNHIETTFLDNARIVSSNTYRISFKAKWLSGSPQVHTRLYFNRLAQTSVLPMAQRYGTPGAVNSSRITNAGPTYQDLRHDPAVPVADQPVTVTVSAEDVNGLDTVTLFYRRDRQTWQTIEMTQQNASAYVATLPGAPAGTLIQFYVQGVDGGGASSFYPSAGPESRALYRVQEVNPDDSSRHSLRILMTQDDLNEMFTRVNFTSNERHGATVIWRDTDVYYDVDLRLKGSGFSRGSNVTGFNLSFPSDRLLFGEHDKVSIDRQGGPWGPGASQRELAIKYIANRAGDIPMMYDDVI